MQGPEHQRGDRWSTVSDYGIDPVCLSMREPEEERGPPVPPRTHLLWGNTSDEAVRDYSVAMYSGSDGSQSSRIVVSKPVLGGLHRACRLTA
jgi:hypothetical protein